MKRRYYSSLTTCERKQIARDVKTMPLADAAAKYGVALGTAFNVLKGMYYEN